MMQEQFNVTDLEKAADKYEKENTGIYPEVGQTSIRDAFIDGAKWQKNALLEWVNEKLAFCKEMILKGEPGFEFKLSVYEKLIEKINE